MSNKILAFCDYFLPGYKAGGPVTTLQNMALRLAPEIHLRIVTRDRDLGDQEPYAGIVPGCWSSIDGVDVLHLAPSSQSVAAMRALIADEAPDVIYLNSFFSRRFTLFPLLAHRWAGSRARLVLAPRGEFAVSALALRAWRKAIYSRLFLASGLLDGVTWQASTSAEADDLTRVLGFRVRLRTAADLSARPLPRSPDRPAKREGAAELVFLGRISPMKNLDWLLRLLAEAPAGMALTIHGPVEDEDYWRDCQALAASVADRVRIRHAGPLAPAEVAGVLASADALILPSRGENFGHVVAEALAAGCPAIVSDRTPWQDVATAGAGWILPLERPGAWLQALRELTAMDEAEHARLRARALALATSRAADEGQLAANRGLFLP